MTVELARAICARAPVCTTLRAMAAGDIVISFDGERGWLEEYRGTAYRLRGQKLLASGVAAMIHAGYITKFCTVTEAGREALKAMT